jgi:hypothetical protein
LETDANVIVGKVASHSTVAEGLSEQVLLFQRTSFLPTLNLEKYSGVGQIGNRCYSMYYKLLLSLQTFSQALATAREHLARSLLK